MKNVIFSGIMPAIITPYDENRKLKRATVKALIDKQLEAGVDGFYVCGGTGEGPVLSAKLRMEMTEAAVEANAGRGKIITHVGAFDSYDTMELTRHATNAGVDGIASLPPSFYFHYNEDEIFDYYTKISDNTNLPVLMYAIKSMVSGNITGLLERMMKIKNVIGLKDTRNNYFDMWKAKMINEGDINVINGPDEMLICGLSMGADGGIGSTYNIMPEKFVKLYKLFKEGKMSEAMQVQTQINKIIEVLFKHSKSLKCALRLSGFNVGNEAYPARYYTKQKESEFKKDMNDAGYKF